MAESNLFDIATKKAVKSVPVQQIDPDIHRVLSELAGEIHTIKYLYVVGLKEDNTTFVTFNSIIPASIWYRFYAFIKLWLDKKIETFLKVEIS